MAGVKLLGGVCRIVRTGMEMLAMSCAFCSSCLVGSSVVRGQLQIVVVFLACLALGGRRCGAAVLE